MFNFEPQPQWKVIHHTKGKKKQLSIEIGKKNIIDANTAKRLVKLRKIKEILVGNVDNSNDVCFSITQQKLHTIGYETVEFESRFPGDRGGIINDIMNQMEVIGLCPENDTKSEILERLKRDHIPTVLKIKFDTKTSKIGVEKRTSSKSQWKLCRHLDGQQKHISVTVDDKYIMDQYESEGIVKLKHIQQILLGKSSIMMPDVDSSHNVCFTIIQMTKRGPEIFNFEAQNKENRTDVVTEIISGMEKLGLQPKNGVLQTQKDVLAHSVRDEILMIEFTKGIVEKKATPRRSRLSVLANPILSRLSRSFTQFANTDRKMSRGKSDSKSQEKRLKRKHGAKQPFAVLRDHAEFGGENIRFESINKIRIYNKESSKGSVHCLTIETLEGKKHRIALGKKEPRDKIAIKLLTKMDNFGNTASRGDVASLTEEIRNLQHGHTLKMKMKMKVPTEPNGVQIEKTTGEKKVKKPQSASQDVPNIPQNVIKVEDEIIKQRQAVDIHNSDKDRTDEKYDEPSTNLEEMLTDSISGKVPEKIQENKDDQMTSGEDTGPTLSISSFSSDPKLRGRQILDIMAERAASMISSTEDVTLSLSSFSSDPNLRGKQLSDVRAEGKT